MTSVFPRMTIYIHQGRPTNSYQCDAKVTCQLDSIDV